MSKEKEYKLYKHTCYVLYYSHNGNKKPFVRIDGVFKTEKQAKDYLSWLTMSDKVRERYSIQKSYTYDYKEIKYE